MRHLILAPLVLSLACSKSTDQRAHKTEADNTIASDAAIVVIAAVDYEYSAIVTTLESVRQTTAAMHEISVGTVAGERVAVVRSGWGKAHAAGATAMAIDLFHPRLIVMAGISGGVDMSSIHSGDVVIASASFQHDLGELTSKGVDVWPPETPAEQSYPSAEFRAYYTHAVLDAARHAAFSPWLLPDKCECEKNGARKECSGKNTQVDRAVPLVCAGTMATGDSFVVDPVYATHLVANHKAVSVDMETAAVAQEATDHGIPYVGIRIIGDTIQGPSGESLYYCLKPLSGPRLTAVMARVLPALVLPRSGADLTADMLDINDDCLHQPPTTVALSAPQPASLQKHKPIRLR